MNDGGISPQGGGDGSAVERVVQVESTDGAYVWVIADRMSACKGCAERSSCGQATLNGMAKPTRIRVLNTLGLQPGSWVKIAVPSVTLFRSMILAYGLPLSGFLIGGSVGAGHSDIAAVVLACIGLGAGILVSRNQFASENKAGFHERKGADELRMICEVSPPQTDCPPSGVDGEEKT